VAFEKGKRLRDPDPLQSKWTGEYPVKGSDFFTKILG
jgi:hypothetical protein